MMGFVSSIMQLFGEDMDPQTGVLDNTDGNITKQLMVAGSFIAWFCSP